MSRMPKLTEDMVIARTKTSDLGTIKKFNCWGSELNDITIIRRFRNVEVLSLSLNNISSLADFQFCQNLVELYIRRNNIKDLSEVCYLSELPRLRRLLLSENPCVETAGNLYRATILRCLPNLEILDGAGVTPEEVEMAQRNGLILEHPLMRRSSPDSGSYYAGEGSPPPASVSQNVVRRNSLEYEYENEQTEYRPQQPQPPMEYYQNGGSGAVNVPISPGTLRQMHINARSPEPLPINTQVPPAPITNVKVTSTKIRMTQTQTQQQQQNGVDNNNTKANNGNKSPPSSIEPQLQYCITNGASPLDNNSLQRRISPEHQYPSAQNQMNGRRQSVDYAEQYFEPEIPLTPRTGAIQNRAPLALTGSGRPSAKQRSKTSNVISAVLCLIPELDWQGLEVVELAIRRRMDELNSD